MAELYDGTMQKRFTRKTKLEEARKVYIVFLSATTPHLYTVMRPDFFMQGCGNRFLYILYKGGTKDIAPSDFDFSVDKELEREEKIKDFAGYLKNIYTSPVKYLYLADQARLKYIDYYNTCRKQAESLFKADELDYRHSYLCRLPEFALKIAGIHLLSRSYKTIASTTHDYLAIMEQDLDYAIKAVNAYYNYYNELLIKWRTSYAPIRNDAKQILELIKRKGCITYSELREVIGWDRLRTSEMIKYLWDTNLVLFVEGSPEPAGGRKPVLLYPFDADRTKLRGTIINNFDFLEARLGLRLR
jgi:hypothetical protein